MENRRKACFSHFVKSTGNRPLAEIFQGRRYSQQKARGGVGCGCICETGFCRLWEGESGRGVCVGGSDGGVGLT